MDTFEIFIYNHIAMMCLIDKILNVEDHRKLVGFVVSLHIYKSQLHALLQTERKEKNESERFLFPILLQSRL